MTRQAALEAAVEATWRKRIREAGGRTVKLRAVEDGVPDRLVLLPGGGLYLVELKRDRSVRGSQLSDIQKLWHERAAELGTLVYVVHGREEILPWIRARQAEIDERIGFQSTLCITEGCYRKQSAGHLHCRQHRPQCAEPGCERTATSSGMFCKLHRMS